MTDPQPPATDRAGAAPDGAGPGPGGTVLIGRSQAIVALVATLLAGTLPVLLVILLTRTPGDERPDPGPSGEPGLPRLSLSLVTPSQGAVTYEESIRLEAQLAGRAAWIELQATGRTPRQMAARERLVLDVPLVEGPNHLRLQAIDARGRRSPPLEVVVVRRGIPAWYSQAAAAARPPIPLPEGIVWGSQAGEYLHQADGSVLVWVAPGRVRTGGEPELVRGEGGWVGAGVTPAREVAVEHGFFLGKHEVTWVQFTRYCQATGAAMPGPRAEVGGRPFVAGERHPVFGVTRAEAEAYCRWAGLRLPTEAEWELAASGGDGRPRPWGSEPAAGRANLGGAGDAHPGPAPVGALPAGAGPTGCLDLAGNVWEWVDPLEGSVEPGAASSPLRGGGWATDLADPVAWARVRALAPPALRSPEVGFRVCRTFD